MDKKIILEKLQTFIQSKQTDKKMAKLLSKLSLVTEDTIEIGEQPQYYIASMTCNSTGVGVSSFQGSETQRTVALDYVTDSYLFVDGHIGAAEKGLSLFYLKPGQTINYYQKSDTVKLAKEYGFQLHLEYFRDLNFTLRDHRVNRYKVNIIKGPFTYAIRPILSKVSEKEAPFTIGYVYTMNGKEHILIEPNLSEKGSEDLSFLPWLLLGLIFPPVLIIGIFVLFVKAKKERMRG